MSDLEQAGSEPSGDNNDDNMPHSLEAVFDAAVQYCTQRAEQLDTEAKEEGKKAAANLTLVARLQARAMEARGIGSHLVEMQLRYIKARPVVYQSYDASVKMVRVVIPGEIGVWPGLSNRIHMMDSKQQIRRSK